MNVPKARPDIVARDLEDEVVLFNRASGRSVHLNRTAGLIWFFCDGEHTADQISQELAQLTQGADLERIQTEVAQTLDSFRTEGLLE